ncbi:hypothetical protein D3C71_2143080 [compost metagenome]
MKLGGFVNNVANNVPEQILIAMRVAADKIGIFIYFHNHSQKLDKMLGKAICADFLLPFLL